MSIEHTHAFEMVVDDLEAMTGSPRNLYQRRWVDRSVLQAKFPKSAKKLEATPQKNPEEDDWSEWGFNDSCDQVLVTEAWHLPSGKDAKDGRHCIIVSNATLLDDQYDEERFPFAFLRQTPAPWGVRGIPITAQLRPLQLFLNQGMSDFQDSMGIFARPKWLSPRQGNVEKAHLDDDIGTIMEYDYPYKPEAWVPTSLLGGTAVQFVWQVWDKAAEIVGISQYKSSGLVPQNVKSGKAAEVLNDTQDGRFLVSSRLFEAWSMEIVDLAIGMARIIAKHRPDYATRYSHRKYVQMVKFSDVDMERDQFMLECYPASSLANTPSARYDQLQDMFDRGLIDMPTFRRQLGFPDLEGELNRLNAPYELADWLIERYLDAEDVNDPTLYLAPEPSWPLQVLYERLPCTPSIRRGKRGLPRREHGPLAPVPRAAGGHREEGRHPASGHAPAGPEPDGQHAGGDAGRSASDGADAWRAAGDASGRSWRAAAPGAALAAARRAGPDCRRCLRRPLARADGGPRGRLGTRDAAMAAGAPVVEAPPPVVKPVDPEPGRLSALQRSIQQRERNGRSRSSRSLRRASGRWARASSSRLRAACRSRWPSSRRTRSGS